jgi:hypothetical protein
LIDDAFEKMVISRLQQIPTEILNWNLHLRASKQMLSKFKLFKEAVGTSVAIWPSTILIPGLPVDFSDENAEIRNGKMFFTQ